MQTKSLIKAIEKAGFNVEVLKRTFYDHFTNQMTETNNDYYAQGNKYKVHWHDQNGYATCVQVQRLNQHNDSQSDYFPGYWARNIKSVIRDLQEV